MGKALNEQLMIAVKQGDSERAENLIESGADINARDENGYSALDWAAAYADSLMMETLMLEGADDTNDLMSGFLVCQSAFKDKLFGSLVFAVSNGDLIIAEDLFKRGLKVTGRDTMEREALAAAIESGLADGRIKDPSLQSISSYPGMRFVILKAMSRIKQAEAKKKIKKNSRKKNK